MVLQKGLERLGEACGCLGHQLPEGSYTCTARTRILGARWGPGRGAPGRGKAGGWGGVVMAWREEWGLSTGCRCGVGLGLAAQVAALGGTAAYWEERFPPPLYPPAPQAGERVQPDELVY